MTIKMTNLIFLSLSTLKAKVFIDTNKGIDCRDLELLMMQYSSFLNSKKINNKNKIKVIYFKEG